MAKLHQLDGIWDQIRDTPLGRSIQKDWKPLPRWKAPSEGGVDIEKERKPSPASPFLLLPHLFLPLQLPPPPAPTSVGLQLLFPARVSWRLASSSPGTIWAFSTILGVPRQPRGAIWFADSLACRLLFLDYPVPIVWLGLINFLLFIYILPLQIR